MELEKVCENVSYLRTPHLQGHELVPVFQDVAIPFCETFCLGLEKVLGPGDKKHHQGVSLLTTYNAGGRQLC